MAGAVIIPTLNEAPNLAPLLTAVEAAVPGVRPWIVDDASPDGTADEAERLGATVLRRTGRRGLGLAYREGFAAALAAGHDPIWQMDADLSHDPADLPRLVGGDLVLGSRYVPGGGTRSWGAGRRVISRWGSFYARVCLGLPQRDLTGGFKRWDAALLRRVLAAHPAADGYAFQVETTWLAARLGARIVEVPIVFTERTRGRSKMNGRIAWEAAWAVPRLRCAGR